MRKILLVQPHLQPPGGGEGVAAWMIEALKQDHVISVLTWRPIDLAPINRYFGTSLRPSDFTAYLAYPALHRLLDRVPVRLGLLKNSLLLRMAKQMKDDYDLVITANDEADLGRLGIQYVHFPWAYQPRPPIDLRWYHCSSAVVEAYYRFCVRISGFSFERMKQNLTLVNSNWTGEKVRERHGIESTTLYPPAPGSFPDVPWAEREDGFVCIGRISLEKELDKIIDILTEVREQGYDLHLHIIGTKDDNPGYYAHIQQRVQTNASWIFLNEDLPRQDLVRLVAQHRYGIHGMKEEHFGMAVAEMVRAGCIVFVPRGGGQMEIVAGEERLLYQTPQEAVAKIRQAIADAAAQQSLRDFLRTRKDLFSTEHFINHIRDIVRQFFRNKEDTPA
jgi:glycosyltransferase involved in cell wall biosynthesis